MHVQMKHRLPRLRSRVNHQPIALAQILLLRDRLGGGDHPPDWRVETTVDPELQDMAERAVQAGLREIVGHADPRGTPEYTGNAEGAIVSVDYDGNINVLLGSVDEGQGHATTTAQVVAGMLKAPAKGSGSLKFFATDSAEKFRRLGTRFLGREIRDVEHVDLKE